jgi:hypothetical protein
MYKKILATSLVLTCLLQPSLVFADDHGWHGGHGGHGWHGGSSALGIVALSIAGAEFLYSAGMFYRSTPAGYVVVPAPMGAVVPALPPGYTVVYMGGMPYYYYGNAYYAAAPNGYVVTAPPAIAATVAAAPGVAAVQAPAPAPISQQPATAPATNEPSSAVETYISNGNGSFTVVTLQKTDKGFLGPQGEFYADHPTEEQLKARYCKK